MAFAKFQEYRYKIAGDAGWSIFIIMTFDIFKW